MSYQIQIIIMVTIIINVIIITIIIMIIIIMRTYIEEALAGELLTTDCAENLVRLPTNLKIAFFLILSPNKYFTFFWGANYGQDSADDNT